MSPLESTAVVCPKAKWPALCPGHGRIPHTPSAPKTVAVALSISQVLSLLRSTSTMTSWLVGLLLARKSTLGQKSISHARVVSEARIAAASAGGAFLNALLPSAGGDVWPAFWPMLMMRFGMHTGSGVAVVDGCPQVRSNTWMRLFGRSQT